MKIKSITIAILILSVAGCSTYDPYTGDKEVSKATTGAAIGAGVAAIGAAIFNRDDDPRSRNQRVLKAAAAGGAIGGSVGYYMDRQEAKLRQKLEGTGVRVVREGDYVQLVMPSNITFGTDSSDLKPQFLDVLDSVAIVLEEFDKTLVEVTGHTDSTGSDSYNMSLSERRAESVTSALRAEGVNPDRLLTKGFGEERPIAENSTLEGRAQNRRVEILLVPIAS